MLGHFGHRLPWSVLRHSRDGTLNFLVDSRRQPWVEFKWCSVISQFSSQFHRDSNWQSRPSCARQRIPRDRSDIRTNMDSLIRASTATSRLIHLASTVLTQPSVRLASQITLAVFNINNSGSPKVVQNLSSNHLESLPVLRSAYLTIMLTSFDSATGSTVVAC